VQVWFQDICFRNGVYQCFPVDERDHSFDVCIPLSFLSRKLTPICRILLFSNFRRHLPHSKKVVWRFSIQRNLWGAYSFEQMSSKMPRSKRLSCWWWWATHYPHRFSKLFITHLDDEFKKQPNAALKHLVSNQVSKSRSWLPTFILLSNVMQFEGTQIYATTCLRCGARSENNSDFLEIEVNLEVRYIVVALMLNYGSTPHDRIMPHSKAASKYFFNLRHYLGIISNVFCDSLHWLRWTLHQIPVFQMPVAWRRYSTAHSPKAPSCSPLLVTPFCFRCYDPGTEEEKA